MSALCGNLFELVTHVWVILGKISYVLSLGLYLGKAGIDSPIAYVYGPL